MRRIPLPPALAVRVLSLAAATLVVGAVGALPAAAAPPATTVVLAAGDTGVADVVASLRADPVYVDADSSDVDLDRDQVRAQIARSNAVSVYVAVLPPAAASALGGESRLNTAIGSRLGARAVLFTLVGDSLTGGAGNQTGFGAGQADAIAKGASTGDVTSRLVRVVEQVQSVVAQQGVPASPSSDGYSGGGSGGGGGGTVLAVLALLGIGGGGLYYARSRKRASRQMEGSRADVTSLYDRLGADVSTLSPGDDAVARQALADAAERYNATGALLSQADTPGEYEAARRTVVEGLAATRMARTRLGLDPGPEVPPPPGSGPQLAQAERVAVGDQEYEASPTYTPGLSHYWGGGLVGGRMVPGGWYGVPFWESMLIGSALGSAFGGGGGLFGGGYGGGYGGYERGYEEGVDDARDARGGGGDWGGGGFDLGGGSFGGGGDWGGGGGGDWGGGGGGDGGSW
ncbi:MAG: hypothetical protein JWM64_3001 [Frankiales bacterium]|nr:hypothetical protein [Frankiales bacterium]